MGRTGGGGYELGFKTYRTASGGRIVDGHIGILGVSNGNDDIPGGHLAAHNRLIRCIAGNLRGRYVVVRVNGDRFDYIRILGFAATSILIVDGEGVINILPRALEGNVLRGHGERGAALVCFRISGHIARCPAGEGVAGRGGGRGHGHKIINLVVFRCRQRGCARRGSTIIIAHGEVFLDIVNLNYVAVPVGSDGEGKILSFLILIAGNVLIQIAINLRTNIHRGAWLRFASILHTVIVILNGVVLLRGNVLAIVAGIGGNGSVKFRLLGAGFIGIPAVKLIGKIVILLGLLHVRLPQPGLGGAAVYTLGSALNCGKAFKSRVLYQEVYAADIFLVQDDCVVVVIGILAGSGIIPVTSRIRATGDRHIHGRQGVVALFIGIFRTRRGIPIFTAIISQIRIQCLFRI